MEHTPIKADEKADPSRLLDDIANRTREAADLTQMIDERVHHAQVIVEDSGEADTRKAIRDTDRSLNLLAILQRELKSISIAAEGYRAPKAEPFVGSREYLKRDWDHSLREFELRGGGESDEEFDALVRTRVPDLDALREKVRIVRDRFPTVNVPIILTQLLADIDGLN